MPDIWDQFKDAPQSDPWSQFKDASAQPTAPQQSPLLSRVDQDFARMREFTGNLGGAVEGYVGAIPGALGNIEALGRSALSLGPSIAKMIPPQSIAAQVLSRIPSDIAGPTVLPTSTQTINDMFGEAKNEGQARARAFGSAFAPLGARAGALASAAQSATQIDDALAAAKQLTRSPGYRANEILARALERDKLSPENVAQALRQFGDKPVTIADVAGNATARKARLVNTLEGPGSDEMAPFLANRQTDQHARILDDIAANFSQGGDTYEISKALKASRSRAARPLYEAAFNNTKPVWNNRIQQFLDDPITKEGMARGLKVQRLEALAEGRPFDPKAYGIVDFNAAGDPIIGGTPNLRLLDAVKDGLDDILEGYRDGVTGKLVLDRTGQAVEKVRKAYVAELDSATANLVPEYKAAREAWSGPSQTMDAMDRGGRFLKMAPGQIRDTLEAMPQGDREFFKLGAAQHLREVVENTRDNLDAANRIFGNQASRDRIAAVFGKDAANRMAVSRGAENMMTATNQFVRGNSATMNKAAEMAEGGGVAADVAKDAAKGFVAGGVRGAVTLPLMNQAESKIDAFFNRLPPEVARALAERLTATGPAAQSALSDLVSQTNALKNARVVPGGGAANIPSIDPRVLAAILGLSGASKMAQQ